MQAVPAQPWGEAMSWEEYAQRASDPPSEYINGRLVMVPSPTHEHQQACRRIANLLEAVQLPGMVVVEAWGWRIGDEEFIPDVMVHPVTDETVRFTGAPLLVIEVLSTQQAGDLVIKPQSYARGRAQNYWVIDPPGRVLDAFVLSGDGFRHVVQVERGAPQEIELAGMKVSIDVTALFA